MTWTNAKIAIVMGTAAAAGAALFLFHNNSPRPVLAEFDWQTLKQEGRLSDGEVIQMGGTTVLKLENTNETGLSLPILKVMKPPITAMHYEVAGEIKYDVESDGHLNLWSYFPPLKEGLPEPQYYSFTGELEGPLAKIHGSSDWRKFSLPLDRTGKTYPESFTPRMDTAVTAHAPTRLELGLFLSGRGVVYLRKAKLMQTVPDGSLRQTN